MIMRETSLNKTEHKITALNRKQGMVYLRPILSSGEIWHKGYKFFILTNIHLTLVKGLQVV